VPCDVTVYCRAAGGVKSRPVEHSIISFASGNNPRAAAWRTLIELSANAADVAVRDQLFTTSRTNKQTNNYSFLPVNFLPPP